MNRAIGGNKDGRRESWSRWVWVFVLIGIEIGIGIGIGIGSLRLDHSAQRLVLLSTRVVWCVCVYNSVLLRRLCLLFSHPLFATYPKMRYCSGTEPDALSRCYSAADAHLHHCWLVSSNEL